MSRSVSQGDQNFTQVKGKIEQFRKDLVEEIRRKENSLESELENSNRFENIRVFSRLPPENGKALQLLAASISINENIKEKVIISGEDKKSVENYLETLNSNREQFFTESNASHYTKTDKVVFHRLPADFKSNLEIDPEISDILNPLFSYLFSEDLGMENFKAILAHEGTHSWLHKNSQKSEKTERILRAAEESLCYTSDFVIWNHIIEESNLVEELPFKERVVWMTNLLVERIKHDKLGIDWVRETGREMYASEKRRENPFRFLFEKALTDNEETVIARYRHLVENSLKPVFQELSQMVEDVERSSLEQGGKASYERAKQIEEQVEWDEPKRAEKRIRSKLYEKCKEKKCRHEEIEEVIGLIIEQESEKLAEYAQMVSNLEEKLESEELLEEADQVKEDLMQTSNQFAAAD